MITQAKINMYRHMCKYKSCFNCVYFSRQEYLIALKTGKKTKRMRYISVSRWKKYPYYRGICNYHDDYICYPFEEPCRAWMPFLMKCFDDNDLDREDDDWGVDSWEDDDEDDDEDDYLVY